MVKTIAEQIREAKNAYSREYYSKHKEQAKVYVERSWAKKILMKGEAKASQV